ncbi:MAG TPA: kelch repeat-containing protein, partial [Desulfosalsimonadaceae bacterium]|nr:kelch repeat-containing protein [Desulfosalsimonadaceae bacterium]
PYYAYTRQAATGTVECYSPDTNQWTYCTPMSSKRLLHAAATGPDGNIYVFGGAANMSAAKKDIFLNSTEMYDPQTDTWSKRKPMPKPRGTHAAVLAADNRIYIIGGAGRRLMQKGRPSPPLRDVFIYDPIKNSWSRGPSMNIPRSTLAAVATPDGKIYAIGGTDAGAYNIRETMNFFLPEEMELSTGKLQKTVEVLDITH